MLAEIVDFKKKGVKSALDSSLLQVDCRSDHGRNNGDIPSVY
jgi:hypothetical protein